MPHEHHLTPLCLCLGPSLLLLLFMLLLPKAQLLPDTIWAGREVEDAVFVNCV
jgi:hypothetical protein